MFTNTSKLLVPLTTMVVAAVVTVGSGATWSSQTGVTSHVTAGSVLIDNSAGDGVTLNISKLSPGDSLSGTMTIHNTGDLAADLALSEGTPVAGSTAFEAGKLTLAIATSTDGTTWTTVQPAGPIGTVGANKALGSLSADDAASGGTDQLRVKFTVALASTAANSNQGATVAADYTFVSTEKSGQSPVGW